MATDQLLMSTVKSAAVPVFVDASGHRARRVNRLGVLLVVLCLGYGIALALAAATGVRIGGVIVPYPVLGSETSAKQAARVPKPATSTDARRGAQVSAAPSTGGGAVPPASSSVAAPVGASSVGASRLVTSNSNSVVIASRPVASPSPTTSPLPVPAASPTPATTHAKSSVAPVPTNRPTSLPTHSATTARGRGPLS